MNDDVKIKFGLYHLFKKDGYLMEKNINERAITHKLAEYYQQIYFEWDVDCEFNRNFDRPKEIEINPKELLRLMADYAQENREKVIQLEQISINNFELLISQLKDPDVKYIDDLDLWIFILKLNGKTIKKTIFPDIIIHHRGTSENNIVFEVKKTINKDSIDRLYDIVKLATLTHSPKYKYRKGIFIDIPVLADYKRFVSFKKKQGTFKGVYEYLPDYL